MRWAPHPAGLVRSAWRTRRRPAQPQQDAPQAEPWRVVAVEPPAVCGTCGADGLTAVSPVLYVCACGARTAADVTLERDRELALRVVAHDDGTITLEEP